MYQRMYLWAVNGRLTELTRIKLVSLTNVSDALKTCKNCDANEKKKCTEQYETFKSQHDSAG